MGDVLSSSPGLGDSAIQGVSDLIQRALQAPLGVEEGTQGAWHDTVHETRSLHGGYTQYALYGWTRPDIIPVVTRSLERFLPSMQMGGIALVQPQTW